VLTTARLTLVPHRPEHFPAYAAFWAKDPGHFLRSLAPMRPEDAWTRLLRHFGHWTAFGYGPFLGFDSDGALVAEIGFADFRRNLGPRFDGVPEGMWKVDLQRQGQGLAGEAMAVIAAWLDRIHAPPRSVCMIDPANVASIRLAERLGFTEFERTTYRDGPIVLYERLLPKP
jgi:RimJ/RimL family protein N-acetyltransferase